MKHLIRTWRRFVVYVQNQRAMEQREATLRGIEAAKRRAHIARVNSTLAQLIRPKREVC